MATLTNQEIEQLKQQLKEKQEEVKAISLLEKPTKRFIDS